MSTEGGPPPKKPALPTAAQLLAAKARPRARTDLFVARTEPLQPEHRPPPPPLPPPLPPPPPRAERPQAAAAASSAADTAPALPAAAAPRVSGPLTRANPPAAPPCRGAASFSSSASTSTSGNPNSILVSRRQQGNPVLKAIRNVPWVYTSDSTADYVMGDSTCALYLSLRYHLLHPDYLLRRLRELSPAYSLRIVLLHVDSEDAEKPVLNVTKLATAHDCTVLLAWSVAEAARYLETLKAYARKPADLIKERSDGAFLSQLGETLTAVRPLNKTDVATLHATFGSLKSIMHASQAELSRCPGLGEKKVKRLREAFAEPFVPRSARGAPPKEK